MRFEVGAHVYKVEIPDYPLADAKGRSAMGLTLGDRRLIQISPHCPPGERLDVLLHELRHVWCYHFPPPPAGGEADADYYASTTGTIMRQIMNQGGPSALLSLDMATFGSFDPSAFGRSLADYSEDRMLACSVCQQRIAPGSAAITDRLRHPTAGVPIIALAFYCPHCEHVQAWAEFANAAGRPNGACAIQPVFLDGDDAMRFQDAFPEKVNYQPAG